jgi:excinuclease ABC subunit A
MPEEDRDLFLYGTGKERIPLSYRNYQGRMRHYTSSFPGIVKHLQRRYTETESEQVRDKIEEYMANVPCPVC